MKRFVLVLVCVTVMFSRSAPGQQAGPETAEAARKCSALSSLKLEHATVTTAELVAAGAMPPPASEMGPSPAALFKQLPAFCRVAVTSKPTSDSDIKIEVWMPASGWNSKYRGQGNGGFAGEIAFPFLASSVLQGYATAGTDTGHSASGIDATWALGHPEKVADYGWRGIHEMTVSAKAVIQAFYGSGPAHSYFAACSDGGREALMEAQRFPADYDGILAGAPANYWTNLLTNAVVNAQATTLDPASYIPAAKISLVGAAANAACDAQDGVTDEIINDPRQCHFDPASLLCKDAAATSSCLTQPQVTALKQLYGGGRDSSGKLIFPGYLPGAEEGFGGWPLWITGAQPGKSLMFAFGVGYFSDMVYNKADWDYRTFQLDRDLKVAIDKTAQSLNSTDPNLKPFASHGGKLILYHGWNDPAISSLNTIDYYNNVIASVGDKEVESFIRLYMVPGMQHCSGGPGVSSFDQFGTGPKGDASHDMYTALEDWVEKGTAPSTIVAAKLGGEEPGARVDLTRPLCVYPQIAKYKGSGDTKDAASFTCVSPSN